MFLDFASLSSGGLWTIVELVSAGLDTSSVAKPWYKSSKVAAISRQIPSSLVTIVSPWGLCMFKFRVDGSWADVTAGPGGGISSTGLSEEEMSTVVSAELNVHLGDVVGVGYVVTADVWAWIGVST